MLFFPVNVRNREQKGQETKMVDLSTGSGCPASLPDFVIACHALAAISLADHGSGLLCRILLELISVNIWMFKDLSVITII